MNAVARQRLHSQRLVGTPLPDPVAVVAWLGAVQAQDYPGARWALGLRAKGATDALVAQAVDLGAIIRTHVLRPTWHFVTPADLRWLLALTGPRVQARTAHRRRELELDAAGLRRSRTALTRALRGGRHATRAELGAALEQAGISVAGQRFPHILMAAELEGLVCSGAWRGKQPTWALLDERVPPTPPLEREAALAELARRYFCSRGPATLADFTWWSSLTMPEARAAVALAGKALAREDLEGTTYWRAAEPGARASAPGKAWLLPNYDEYTVAYRDRRAVFDARHVADSDTRTGSALNNALVVGGEVLGTWQRRLSSRAVGVSLRPFVPLTPAQQQAAVAAARRYAGFLGLALEHTENG